MSIVPSDPPQNFLDPVMGEVMVDPVVGSDGRTYERNVAERFERSPFTREPFAILVDNVGLRSDIFERYPEIARQYETLRKAKAAPGGLKEPARLGRTPASTPEIPRRRCWRPDSGLGYEEMETGRYEGEYSGGWPHGHGTYLYHSGHRHVGEWYRGRMSGHGRIDFANGGFYEGGFLEGLFHGQGRLNYVDGATFEGTYDKGQRLHGIVTNRDYRYEGPFKNDKRHGWGRETIQGKDYKSQYDNGKVVARRPRVN